ncbi:hypothetical protein ABIB25_004440 [Nakamurella sp. UYEF19]|uniref:hypothetical protein n=1 Tax=Nakamurella sp. UYEF19 TaxID=1756392 RepID=UPI0033976D02
MIPSSEKPGVARQGVDGLVVGLDVLAAGERTADRLLVQVISLLQEAGAESLLAATHHVQVFGRSHVAMSISLTGPVGRTRALELVADAIAVDDGAAGALWTGETGTGLPSLQQSARVAATEHRDQRSGRVVHFPGVEGLTGVVSLCSVLETAIDRIDPFDGRPLPNALLMTGDVLRPRWLDGELVLHVRPGTGGVWVPTDVTDPAVSRPE